MKGAYIVLEGVVGTGKTTQAKKLVEFLKGEYPGRQIILTREPGGSEIADAIRKLVQGTDFEEEMDPVCEAYLYASSRAQTLRRIVKPAIDKGGIVIADRSFISSAAYQGYAHGLGVDKVLEINTVATEEIAPDLILFLDIDPEISVKRTFDKDGDKFEKREVDFFRKVEKGYREVSHHPLLRKKWENIDARGSVDVVFERIRERVTGFLQEI